MDTYSVLQAAYPAIQHLDLQNIDTSPMLPYSNVMECFEITALVSALVPRSATFLTLSTLNILDLTSSCIHRYASSLCLQVCDKSIRWQGPFAMNAVSALS